jgi:hypothetical protein
VRSDWLNFIGESCLCLANQEMQGPVLPEDKRSILAESTKDHQYYLESKQQDGIEGDRLNFYQRGIRQGRKCLDNILTK